MQSEIYCLQRKNSPVYILFDATKKSPSNRISEQTYSNQKCFSWPNNLRRFFCDYAKTYPDKNGNHFVSETIKILSSYFRFPLNAHLSFYLLSSMIYYINTCPFPYFISLLIFEKILVSLIKLNSHI